MVIFIMGREMIVQRPKKADFLGQPFLKNQSFSTVFGMKN